MKRRRRTRVPAKEVNGWNPEFKEEEECQTDFEDGSLDEDSIGENEVSNKNAKFDVESDVEEIPETVFEQEQVVPIELHFNIEGTNGGTNDKDGSNDGMNGKQSKDPFNIYDLLKKQQDKDKESVLSEDVLKYPPGFTPKEHFDVSLNLVGSECGEVNKESKHEKIYDLDSATKICNEASILKEDVETSTCRAHFSKTKILGGSIIQVMEDLIKIGQVMGYKMEGCSRIIEEETKIENGDVNDIKLCWGGFRKKMLWEYLNHVIDTWNGEVVIMGDFNKVQSREERYGTTFNKRGADVFNSFISLGGLVDVPLEGNSFTWVHKSTSKMIKLDRPTLLREFCVDYALVPFRFYHYWYEFEGFYSCVEEVWKKQGYLDVNAFNAFMMKLSNLKAKIRIWIKARKEKSSIQKTKLKGMLTDLDLVIDKGEANSDILNKRLHILKDIQLIENLTLWRWQKNLRLNGTLKEFLNHFNDRFDRPISSRLMLDMDFPNTLSLDQRDELECSISKDEFKRVVWDCGLDKSPGPDGFTFDDVVLMGHWSDSNISSIVQVFRCFFHASGLRINMQKSKLMGIGVDDVKISQPAKSIGCLTLTTPFSYLGVKVGGKKSRVKSWDEIINKLLARLSKWNMKTLSIEGRLTLLKSSPFEVVFFNAEDEKEKKSSWVSWKKVLAAKEKGGLGTSSFYALNWALVFKWVWLFKNDNNSLWAKLKSKGMNLFSFIKKRVGNVEKSSFWEEVWKGGDTLKSMYPRLYALELSKNISVANKLAQVDMVGSFRHPPRGGVELQQYTWFFLSWKMSFFQILNTGGYGL
nr:RNA-directed DNA polymerase, eukaryota, reverse transcriptase zinc-binding domain protein [Tanacetum cinerariifolium]